MDDRQGVVFGNVAQQVLQLIRIVGVHLSRHARLPEPPFGETQQRIVAG
jgi:hypothetical protein